MFILDGKPLSPDRAFTHNGISYPANWLRLTTLAEKEAIGITEQPDPTPYDQRFYWGPNNPKDHGQLVDQWNDQTRDTANSLLTPSDWMVIREADNGAEVPLEVKAYRQLIRERCGIKLAAIEATTTTDELAAYITGPDYPNWGDPTPVDDVIPLPDDAVASGGAV
jgi:hypothetical protein